MRQLDARLDAQIKTMIVLREQVMNQTYGMQTTLLSASSATPDIWPVKGQVSSSYGFRASPGASAPPTTKALILLPITARLSQRRPPVQSPAQAGWTAMAISSR